ncbi:Protein-L-isoaspartate(D-aspartate) O-methyltransferase [Boothiomyces macroporosus]|uniref:protein-L-isoaspartate(D-aspartate) O-methyltransferase n=1 Tax=Boothiomyces macroporosus TaxID=261099 RepID=A0AAD5XZW2_9FUNG|nr:Protein-L-isoaspartate(D-aspartate) O-methyltransferase [Boothiomyces macroporosus]
MFGDNPMGELLCEIFANIESGLLRSDRVAHTMKLVDRANYCSNKSDAYVDTPQYIGYNKSISAPRLHAKALEYLAPNCQEGAKVLDIGTGSGYLSACLAQMVGRSGKVIGVDSVPEIVKLAKENVSREDPTLLDHQLQLLHVDDEVGYASGAPFDAIHVNIYHTEVPKEVIDN